MHKEKNGLRDDFEKSVMYMMAALYNKPGFRDSLTPYGSKAFRSSRGKSEFIKARKSYIDLAPCILKYAKQYKGWRDVITAEDIQHAMQEYRMLPKIIELAEGSESFHWRCAVVESSVVPEFLKCADIPHLFAKNVEEQIKGYPPYRVAFQHDLQLQ